MSKRLNEFINGHIKITYQDDHKEYGFNPMAMVTVDKEDKMGIHALSGLMIEHLVPMVKKHIKTDKSVTIGVDYMPLGEIKSDFVFALHIDGDKAYYEFIPYSVKTGEFLERYTFEQMDFKLGRQLSNQFGVPDAEWVGAIKEVGEKK